MRGFHPPPDDMRLAGYALFALAEGGPTIVVPCHLEQASRSPASHSRAKNHA